MLHSLRANKLLALTSQCNNVLLSRYQRTQIPYLFDTQRVQLLHAIVSAPQLNSNSAIWTGIE